MNDLPDGLTRERGLHLLREMLRIRQFEERNGEIQLNPQQQGGPRLAE